MEGRQAKWYEAVFAWLGLWTPPRGVEIPPVPKVKLAIGGGALLLALVILGIVFIPRYTAHEETKRERAAREAAERHAALLRSVEAEQRPRTAAGEPAGREVAARKRLLSAASAKIEADAKGRTEKHIRGMECEPFPRSFDRPDPVGDVKRRAAAYQCVAVTAEFNGAAAPGKGGIIGIPFRLVLHFDTGRFAWCRVVPLGAADRLKHQLPAECQAPAT
jgi:hypothetical protein